MPQLTDHQKIYLAETLRLALGDEQFVQRLAGVIGTYGVEKAREAHDAIENLTLTEI